MKIHSLIVDDFLEDFARWRTWLDTAEFADVISEVDGVTYPNICSDLPPALHQEIVAKLRAVAGLSQLNWLFARMSPAGVQPPHWAHNDASMGAWSMMLYVNRAEHCDGGTALLEHAEGEPTPEIWKRDTNSTGKWFDVLKCPMVPNRAFIFPAGQWHGALPRHGFGTTQADSRVVITAFFT